MSYAVTNPATGETVKTYDTITDAELEAAIAAADEAHRTWSKSTTVEQRAALIRRVSELHTERRKELAELIVREMGKPIGQALGEVDFAAAIYGYYADHSPDFLKDEPIQLLAGDGSAVIRRSSLGVLLGVMPWNFPYYQVARFAGPNLIIGNTILLKHAEQCPESAAAMQQIFLDAGFPAGAYVNIYASHDQIEQVIADPRVQGVSLTGSERAGAAVAEIAGRHLKKVVLELGGSDPFILLSTDDLDATVQNAVDARLDNSGQSCNAAKRFIVADELYEPFLEKFTAKIAEVEATDPTSADSALGPLSSLKAAERRRRAGQARDRARRDARARRHPRRRVLPDDRADGRHAREPRLQGGVLRPGRAGVPREGRGRCRAHRERHPVRPGLVRLHHRPGAGAPRRRRHRGRHGVRERRARRRRRAAVRRHQALGLGPRARPLRRRRVREQEDDPHRLTPRRHVASASALRR